jgi:hypothetical protein
MVHAPGLKAADYLATTQTSNSSSPSLSMRLIERRVYVDQPPLERRQLHRDQVIAEVCDSAP